MEVCNLGLQGFVNILRAAYESDGGHAEAVTIDGVFGSLGYPWVVCKAQVVVCAEVENLFAVSGDHHVLWRRNDSLNLVCACFSHVTD